MFFRKDTNKLISKLVRNHGYAIAVVRINSMTTDEMTYQDAEVMYVLTKSGVILGMLPIGGDEVVSLIKFQAGMIFSVREVRRSDIHDLRMAMDIYGYVLVTSEEEEEKTKLTAVTSIGAKDDD